MVQEKPVTLTKGSMAPMAFEAASSINQSILLK